MIKKCRFNRVLALKEKGVFGTYATLTPIMKSA